MSSKGSFDRYLKKRLDMIIKEATKEYRRIAMSTLTPFAKEIEKDVGNIYDRIIYGFYEYVPEYYHRHDVKPKRPYGKNLYRAFHSYLTYNNRYVKSLVVDINTSEMKGKNYRVSKDYVLDSVLAGFRSPYVADSEYNNVWGIRNVKAFGVSLNGMTVEEAFSKEVLGAAIDRHIKNNLPKIIKMNLLKSTHPVIQAIVNKRR